MALDQKRLAELDKATGLSPERMAEFDKITGSTETKKEPAKAPKIFNPLNAGQETIGSAAVNLLLKPLASGAKKFGEGGVSYLSSLPEEARLATKPFVGGGQRTPEEEVRLSQIQSKDDVGQMLKGNADIASVVGQFAAPGANALSKTGAGFNATLGALAAFGGSKQGEEAGALATGGAIGAAVPAAFEGLTRMAGYASGKVSDVFKQREVKKAIEGASKVDQDLWKLNVDIEKVPQKELENMAAKKGYQKSMLFKFKDRMGKIASELGIIDNSDQSLQKAEGMIQNINDIRTDALRNVTDPVEISGSYDAAKRFAKDNGMAASKETQKELSKISAIVDSIKNPDLNTQGLTTDAEKAYKIRRALSEKATQLQKEYAMTGLRETQDLENMYRSAVSHLDDQFKNLKVGDQIKNIVDSPKYDAFLKNEPGLSVKLMGGQSLHDINSLQSDIINVRDISGLSRSAKTPAFKIGDLKDPNTYIRPLIKSGSKIGYGAQNAVLGASNTVESISDTALKNNDSLNALYRMLTTAGIQRQPGQE